MICNEEIPDANANFRQYLALGVGNVWNPWLDVRKSSYHTWISPCIFFSLFPYIFCDIGEQNLLNNEGLSTLVPEVFLEIFICRRASELQSSKEKEKQGFSLSPPLFAAHSFLHEGKFEEKLLGPGWGLTYLHGLIIPSFLVILR